MDIDFLLATAPPPVELPSMPELPNDPREAFAALLSFRDGIDLGVFNEAFDTRRLYVLKSLYKERFKRRAFSVLAALEEFPEVREHFKTESAEVLSVWERLREQMGSKMASLVEGLLPKPGESWVLVYTVWESTYGSQGCGAGRYARRSAESRALEYSHHGLEAEVRPKTTASSTVGPGWTDYEVWVKADVLDIEIAKRRPGMSMVDFVQWCWDSGVNPRVYNPWLPHGFEERHGIQIVH